ncbi:MAG: 4-oxalocrotonate tautomerase family protein [Desulfarculales bacterium]|jgi:4-oxalocrotonate tautomerase|nr:4-oxalocrotonate tautomerase family protein [Desulfarculales bacterium]
MPYVQVKMAYNEEPVSTEKKEEFIRAITQVIVDVLGRKKENVLICIEESSPDNWGQGGMLLTKARQQPKPAV